MANGRDYPNSGILFREQKREPHDRDYKGSADVTCGCGRRSQLWLSAWIKEGRKGKFLSLSFKPKEARPAASAPAQNSNSDLDW
jgi:hypothetical protein